LKSKFFPPLLWQGRLLVLLDFKIYLLFYNNLASNKQLASVMKAPRSIYTSLYSHFMTMATIYELILSNVNNRNFLPLAKDRVKIMGKLHDRLRLELGSGSLSHI